MGIPHSWFVDDILILGQTQAQTMERESKIVQLLAHLGIQINLKKSLSQPQQQITYLGHIWDLKQSKIKPNCPKCRKLNRMTNIK